MMKKILFITCLLWLVSITANAEEIPNDEIWYEASEKLTETTNLYNDGLHTNAFNTSISSHTFSDGKGVIKFSGDVTSIGEEAFRGCLSLTSFIIPNSVTSIGDWAFYYCSGLTSITIPNSVISIGESAFQNCYGLTSITIPNSVTSIGSYAFGYCSGLTDVTISWATPVSAHTYAFSNVALPKATLHVPAGTKALYEKANVWKDFGTIVEFSPNITFADSKVKSLCVANWDTNKDGELSYEEAAAVKNLGGAFINNKDITSFDELKYFTGITSIESFAFSDCAGLTSVTIPNSVTSIGVYAFDYCSSLTSVNIPNSVTSIGRYAFGYCSGLTSITIPNSVTSIEEEAFCGCSGLTSVKVDSSNKYYDSRDNCNAIIETSSNALIVGCKNTVIPNSVTSIGSFTFHHCSSLTSITIPNSVTSIGERAFSNCSGLTSVTIPNSVTSIGYGAFCGCSGLTSVKVDSSNKYYDSRDNCNAIIVKTTNELIIGCKNTVIPNSVTSIGIYSFDGCSGLTSITIPNSVTSIGYGAFCGCLGLTSVTIPNTVTSIEEEAFCYCLDLTDVTVNWTNPILVSAYVFSSDTLSKATLHVPAGTKALYEATDVWKNFGVIQETIIDVSSIMPSYSSLTIAVGETTTLTASVLPDDATNKSVTWSSSNESVATVSAEGVVTAVSAGTATITATANDGSGVSASCEVTVEDDEPSVEPSTDISQYDYVLYFNDIEARAGNSLKLELNLKNAAEDITAFECKVVLPDHVTWATTTDKRGNIILVQPTFNTETERTDASYHTISTVKQMTDGSYYIIVYSDAKEYILETDGAVLDIPIVIDDEIESGDYNIILKNLVITKTNTTDVKIDRVVSTLTVPSYELGDANGDTFINVSDIVTVISYMMEENPTSFIFDAADVNLDKLINVTDIVGIIDIMMANANEVKPRMASIKKTASETNKLDYVLKVAPLAVAEGTSDLNATLDLINKEEDITAFECKVYLPEGVEWKSTVDRRGKVILNQPVFNAVEERTDASYHTISTVKQMTDGGYYIIVYSDAKEYILGNSGALLDLPLKLAEGTKAGVYDIKVDGMVITHTDGSDVKPSAYITSIIVGQPSDIALTGEIKSEAINVYKDAWEKNENLTSLDLCKAFGIADDTEFRFKNPNVLIVVSEGTNIKNENNVVVKSEDEYTCNSLVLTDGKPFAAPANFTATNATYTRDITNLSTICLPYTPSTDNFEYYELTEGTVDALRFTKVESPKANTPYLFRKKGEGNTITGSGVEITTDGAGGKTMGTWNMVGTYETFVLTATDDAYALSGGKLYHNTGTLTVNPFRAYFTNTGSSVKSMDIYLDSEYTGIQMTEEGEFVNRNADTYNMSGQKVDDNYKGVVISNGVKTLKR